MPASDTSSSSSTRPEPRLGHFHANAPTTRDRDGIGPLDRIGLAITNGVGTMACAAAFCALALVSLPAAITSGSLIVIVGWVAQTFLQLVLLSIILVGQKILGRGQDAQTAHIAAGIDRTLDRLDEHTSGGIRAILDRLDAPIIANDTTRTHKR